MAVVLKEDTRGKEEEAKKGITYFAKCQKGREDEKLKMIIGFSTNKDFNV